MFVSPNISPQVACSLSSLGGFPLTSNLGRYLGVPIVHDRVNQQTYAPLIDKVLKKLADWKGKVLSPAGRRTLILSTTLAIPLHTMQTALLPSSVTKRLDQINSQWGGTASHSRNHLVNWKRV